MIANQIDVKDENIISWCDINEYLFWTIQIRNVWVSGYVAGVPILSVFSIEYTFKRTFFQKNVKACLWEGLNSGGATGKLSAIVYHKCGYFWGSEEEVIHGTINTGSLTVSDHADSSDGDSAVSERTHSELEIGSWVKCLRSNEDTGTEDDVEDNESDNLISSTIWGGC